MELSHYDPKTLKLITLAQETDAHLLLRGPTGSGKSTLARGIHERSLRGSRPFVTVNLASLHEGTLESELFGHEKGAFTGADRRKVGLLEAAHGGTVFLDEIGELSPRLQARLLEFLQTRKLAPMGSIASRVLDVRVIAATHQPLEQRAREGKFREDLFHRLRVLEIALPSLSSCSEQFGDVVHDLLEEASKRLKKIILRMDKDFAEALELYSWPGNFRELRNVLEFAVLSSKDGVLTRADFPEWFERSLEEDRANIDRSVQDFGDARIALSWNYAETFARFERVFLERALRAQGYRVVRTAHAMGVHKSTLIRKLHAYGISGRQRWSSEDLTRGAFESEALILGSA
jgi:DNA-binding NtrC family response regulator